MDRNKALGLLGWLRVLSLSARRAWIEITQRRDFKGLSLVALRKESVDRNCGGVFAKPLAVVALRKESVDRNFLDVLAFSFLGVALRKESVDRNLGGVELG